MKNLFLDFFIFSLFLFRIFKKKRIKFANCHSFFAFHPRSVPFSLIDFNEKIDHFYLFIFFTFFTFFYLSFFFLSLPHYIPYRYISNMTHFWNNFLHNLLHQHFLRTFWVFSFGKKLKSSLLQKHFLQTFWVFSNITAPFTAPTLFANFLGFFLRKKLKKFHLMSR